MTWEELANAIMGMPSDIRMLQAEVWIPCDFHSPDGELARVVGVSPYYVEQPVAVGNPPSIDLYEYEG